MEFHGNSLEFLTENVTAAVKVGDFFCVSDLVKLALFDGWLVLCAQNYLFSSVKEYPTQ